MHCSCGEVDRRGLRRADVVVRSYVLVRGCGKKIEDAERTSSVSSLLPRQEEQMPMAMS